MPILRPIIVAFTAIHSCDRVLRGNVRRLRRAQTEILGVQILRGHTTTGSGGHAATPVNLGSVVRSRSHRSARSTTPRSPQAAHPRRCVPKCSTWLGYLYEPLQGRSGQIGGFGDRRPSPPSRH